jgi:S-DNA-T family DNA segregation ATPase FtsK/SpoIIIE
MTDKDYMLDVAAIALKCRGLGFPVKYIRTEPGPRVRTHYYRQQPGTSAPLSKVINRSEDISLACGVDTCMITRVKDEIAFAIPLIEPQLIKFDSALFFLSQSIQAKDMSIPLLMGQTPTGDWLVHDLANEPHLLIAGSTGGGKSVFLAELIAALAVMKEPKDLAMYLVDTKKLDLPLFEPLTHVKEVITDIAQVHSLLDMQIAKVRERTQKMQGIARNIREWNSMQMSMTTNLQYQLIIIDELADVMDQDRNTYGTGKQRDGLDTIESKLKTLTQISRAAGIHVIAATQRPSVKIISGDIKANFPMRISFKLPTAADSRVILGESGAENLLGKGDYLYQTFENPDTRRAHGAFVKTEDIARICIQHSDIRRSLEGMRI